MKRIALLVVLMAALMTLGCGKQEQTQAPAEKSATETAAAPAQEPSVVPAEQSATPTTAQTEEATPEQAATETESTAPSMVDQMKEAAQAPAAAVEQAVTESKDTMTAAASSVAETAEEAKQAAMDKMAEGAAVVAETAQAAGAAMAPDSVVLKASYGDVTLPHKMHAENFECSVCHGEGAPGALELGKDKAHALCKGCHQEKGAGPTKCSACHVKS